MTTTIQQRFEAFFADQNDLPVETLAQYRFATEDGYRLPAMNRKYNYFKAGVCSVTGILINHNGTVECLGGGK